jgi:hypothetical protein
MTVLFDCSGCGRRLKVSEVYRGKRTKCPECAAISVVPELDELVVVEPGAIQEAPAEGGVARVGSAAGQAEGVGVAEVGPTCPSCRRVLPRGGVVCVVCGHDFRTGRQLETAHERFEKRWDSGMPLGVRIGLVLAVGTLCLFVAALTGDALWGLAIVFAGSVFLVLLVGTYIKLHLVRTTKGKVLLTRTWCICFIPSIRHQVNVRSYDRILIDASGTDWGPIIILILLFLMCGIPGVILLAWRLNYGPGRFHVYLKNDRRREEFSLFHGANDKQMREVVETLEDLTGLRIDRR